MKTAPKIAYFLSFFGLACTAALSLDRVVHPSMYGLLLGVVVAAVIGGAPGLVHRRAWPLAILLLPVGAYLLLRTTIPPPAAVEGIRAQYHFYVETLHGGVSAYIATFFPLSLADQPELRLLLAFAVFWVVGIASFVGLSLRRAVPAVALMLVLIGFAFTVDTSARAPRTALLFVILAGCTLVLSRGLKRRNWRLRDGIAGVVVGTAGAILALGFLVTAPSAVAEPWQDWRSWDPFHRGASTYSFNWLVQYPELLDPANNVPIMTVESESPCYWRANALDDFTGAAWISSQQFPQRLDVTPSASGFGYTMPPSKPTPPGKTVTETFDVHSVYTNYLFVGGDPTKLVLDSNVPVRTNDMRPLHANRAFGPELSYTVTAVVPDLKPSDVIDKGGEYPGTVGRYLTLPFPAASQIEGSDKDAAWRLALEGLGADLQEWNGLYALNEEITKGAADPYDKTLRIEKYLRKFFQYSLNPPASSYSSPYAAFLFDTHTGYCQHFAGAMALLLRFNGIPSRVAVGFTPGELQGDIYTVTTNNAHAWVEVYFPQVGWVAFDPTPGRNIPNPGPSSSSPGFVNPFTEDGAGAGGTTNPTLPASRPLEEGPTDTNPTNGGGSVWAQISWLPWALAAIIIIAAWPMVRSAWRKRGLRGGTAAQRLQVSLRLLKSELTDYGVSVSPACTVEETFEIVRAQLRLETEPYFPDRVDAILFGGRAATLEDVAQSEQLRRKAGSRLRRKHGWVRAGLAWYGVPRRPPAEGTGA